MNLSHDELMRKYNERGATIKSLGDALAKANKERKWLRAQLFGKVVKTGEVKSNDAIRE